MFIKNYRAILSILSIVFVLWSGMSCRAQDSLNVAKLGNTLLQRIKITGYARASYTCNDPYAPRNLFKVYRAQILARATIDRHFDATLLYDFAAPRLNDLYVDYHLSPYVNFRVGQFKTPFSIENECGSINGLIFTASQITYYTICGTDSMMMPASAGRDNGIKLYGNISPYHIHYDIAVMNGEGRNRPERNPQKDVSMKVSFYPTSSLMLSASYLQGTGRVHVVPDAIRPEEYHPTFAPQLCGFKSNGNFARSRYAVGGLLNTKPLWMLSEFMHGKDAESTFEGCFATGAVQGVLTNFDLLFAYDWLLNYKDNEHRYTVGFQYWFYPRCRFQFAYSRDEYHQSPDKNEILAQVQVRF